MHISIVQNLVNYTFNASFLAFAGSAIFFLCSKDLVHKRYRVNMVVSGVIAAIAAYMYYAMKSVYLAGHTFPTEMRYIDWVVTTPLMLIQFSLLLGFRAKSTLVWKVLLCDIIMIVAGYLGESQGLGRIADQRRWLFFSVGMTAWLGIVLYLYRGIIEQAKLEDVFVKRSIFTLTKFVTFGWLLYPIGYVLRAAQPESGDICQLAYNVGDLINKVGFGAVIYISGAAALAASEASGISEPDLEGTKKLKDTKSNSPQEMPMPKITKVAKPLPIAPEQAFAQAFAPRIQSKLVFDTSQSLASMPQAQNSPTDLDSSSDVRSMQQELLKQMRAEADSKAKLEKLRTEVEHEISRIEKRPMGN
jgi:bacteriorhodopsin